MFACSRGFPSTIMMKSLGHIVSRFNDEEKPTAGKSDPGKAPGHAIGLQVAEYFAAEHPLGN
jgi:hypothetical protein